MTNSGKIKAEVERLKNELIEAPNKSEIDLGRISAFEDILLYIDSLEESVSEDLEEAANKVIPDGIFTLKSSITPEDDEDAWSYEQVIEIFKAGANWKEQQMMKDAIEGLVICDKKLTRGYRDIVFKFPDNLQVGDKVKMIIVKEMEK